MRYRTHIASTLAIGVPLLIHTNSFTIASAAALTVGSVFPDIDEPHSYIGARTRGISDIIGGVFGHRGITHGLAGLIISTLTLFIANRFFGFNNAVVFWFGFGYLAHLIEDSFSKSGVAWLQPLSKDSLQFGFNKLYYVTGSLVETVIMYAFMAVLFLQVALYDLPVFYVIGASLFIGTAIMYEFRKALNMLKLSVVAAVILLLSTTAYRSFQADEISNTVSQQSSAANETISNRFNTLQDWWEDSTMNKLLNFNDKE